MLLLAHMILRPARRILAVLVPFFAIAVTRAELPNVAGTLPEDYLPQLKGILDTAMKQAPQVIMRQIEIAQAEARVYGADAQRMPSLGGDYHFAENQTAIASDSSTRSRDSGLFYNFSLNQPIFAWGALKNAGEIARIGTAIAERNYTEARRSLAVTLRHQYLALVAQKASLRYYRFDEKLKQADLDLAKDRLANGNASQGEVGGKGLVLEDASVAVAQLESDFTAQLKAFVRLAGIGTLTEDALPDDIPKLTYSAENAAKLVAELLRDGGKNTFAAEVAALRVKEADLNYRIAKVRLLPRFNAQAGYSVQNSTNASATSVSQTGVTQETIGLGGSWNIFDGFATKGAKLEALATKRLHERELQDAADAAVDAAQKLERDLALDARKMNMSEVRRGLAEAGLKRAKEEKALGNAPQSTIEAATSYLYFNDLNNANSRLTFLWHWSELISLAGVDPTATTASSLHAREKH